MKKPVLLTIVLLTTCLSSNTFATSPTSKYENWWSPASPENGGNAIAVLNETTAEISVNTKNTSGVPNERLVVPPKSYGEYLSHWISYEYGVQSGGFLDIVPNTNNLVEEERKTVLFCAKGAQVFFESRNFMGHTAKITMTGSPTGSVTIQGHHNTTYTIRWEWVYQYNIRERGIQFPYTRTICFFTITSEKQTHHHE